MSDGCERSTRTSPWRRPISLRWRMVWVDTSAGKWPRRWPSTPLLQVFTRAADQGRSRGRLSQRPIGPCGRRARTVASCGAWARRSPPSPLVGGDDGRDTLALANVGDSRRLPLLRRPTDRPGHGRSQPGRGAHAPRRNDRTRGGGASRTSGTFSPDVRSGSLLRGGRRTCGMLQTSLWWTGLILCSDGLSNELSRERDNADVLATVADPGSDAARDRLVDRQANEHVVGPTTSRWWWSTSSWARAVHSGMRFGDHAHRSPLGPRYPWSLLLERARRSASVVIRCPHRRPGRRGSSIRSHRVRTHAACKSSEPHSG